ncbi:MAG: hypothetical protein JST59_12050, partial [Actinobacteria bacterium]|nr:hypothetical protein [Actinomycetota bacterium]
IVTSTPSTAAISSASSGSDFIRVLDASIMAPVSAVAAVFLPPTPFGRESSWAGGGRPGVVRGSSAHSLGTVTR